MPEETDTAHSSSSPTNKEDRDLTPAEKQRAAMEKLAADQAVQKAKLEAEKIEQKLISIENMPELAKHGDIQRLNKTLETKGLKHDNPWCQRAMVVAAADGKIPIVERLMEFSQGCVDAVDPDSRQGAVHAACKHGHKEVVRMLCATKADMSFKDVDGTPLHVALTAKPQQQAIVLELLRNGAEASEENKKIPGMKKALDEMVHEDQVNEVKRSLFEVVDKGPPGPAKQKLEAAESAARKAMRQAQEFMAEVEEHKEGEILMALDRTLHDERASASRSLRSEAEENSELDSLTAHLRKRRDEIEGLDDLLRRQQGDHDRLHEEHRDLECNFQVRSEHHGALHDSNESSLKDKLAKEEAKQQLAEKTKELQSEMNAQKTHGDSVRRELELAKEELEVWREDQEMAARLTQQAHDRLLDNGQEDSAQK